MDDNPFRVRGRETHDDAVRVRRLQNDPHHLGIQNRVDGDQQHGPGREPGRDRGPGRDQRRDRGRGQMREQGRGLGRGQGRGFGRGQGRGYIAFRYADHDNRDDGAVGERDGVRWQPRAQQRQTRPLGYKMLESLLAPEKNPAVVVQELISFSRGLESLLSEREIRRDLMALLVYVLAKVCDCDSSPQSVVRVLNIVIESDFLCRNLSQHVNSMMTEMDDRYLRKVSDQFRSILKILQTLMQRVTHTTKDVHVVLTLIDVVARTLETRGYPVESDVNILLAQLLLCCKKQEEEKAHKSQRVKTSQELPPPNDFREIPIFPDIDEITTNVEPYLRGNVVHGRYKDLTHYLDVQFRLLRQDFLEPLKLGIAEYHVSLGQTNKSRKLKDIRIYHEVRVHYPICTNDGITHRVSFDISKLRGVRWQATKRLTFGSLVCLSKDNFQSVVFATIANRKPDDLEQGLVDLRFQDMTTVSEIDAADVFIMAESSAYFEAYRHVLKGLQEVRENSMPLQRYIIQVSKDVQPPRYLRNNRHATYNLAPLTNKDSSSDDADVEEDLLLRNTRASRVEALRPSSWPGAETLYLDESQLKAVQAALTQELAIIQGPPGTGKTYIGLKIVQALLHNSSVWHDEEDKNPILVVCYTNHALDQFLEGIMKFSGNVVRVGGRSNSEDLKTKNLNHLKREQRKGRSVERAVHVRTSTILREMYSLRQCMELAQRKVERSMNGIVSEDYLQPFMTRDHYATLTMNHEGYRKPTSCILEWLGLSGNFRVMAGHEVGIAAFMGQDGEPEEAEADEQADEEEELEVEEEAEVLTAQRILDDDEVDDFLFEDDTVDNHIVLDINELGTEQQVAQDGWQVQGHQKKRMRRMLLHNLRKSDKMSEINAKRVINVWAMRDINSRWQLYRYWVSEYCKNEQKRMEIVQEKYENLSQELKEVRVEEDLSILRRASVIGMTTTGAAKHRAVLQRVGPKIVVVEEAAEVLESHIVTTLSADCEHLILIGDHQQLRPNPTVYRLAKEYNLDISLFERLINNGVPFQTLSQQHRMRPEISVIMKNHFYENLQDHESVKGYPDVAGISSNVFFLDHDFAEEDVEDSKSKSNLHEVEVLVGLCKYLIQQGQYQPTQITILTTYVGQLLNFKKRMPRQFFSGVRICAVDSFQGEENDIILLSLVRSNHGGNIGFLKVSNRMCVALSRARHGFFCIGNFQKLADKNTLWNNIVQEMKGSRRIGKSLSLICHNHPDVVTRVVSRDDFLNVPEGGCSQPCEFRLDCGHSCGMLCHPTDPKHKEYKCLKKCEHVFTGCGHRCRNLCFQTCERCNEKVTKRLRCGHSKTMSCYQQPETATCHEICETRLPCGHKCKERCGKEPCTTVCEETTFRTSWPCGHPVSVKCSDGPEKCPAECGAVLDCSHNCGGTCGSCKRGKLHVQCKQKCNRTLVCGHGCTALCTKDCPPCSKKCENRCVHSKCPNRCGDPCTPCQEPCPWRCPHFKCTKKCSEACDRKRCDVPCRKNLKCGHPCIGLCGEPCPNKCRVCHEDEVTEILFGNEDEPGARFVQLEDCGHVFEITGFDRWMCMEENDDKSIQLKMCPRCKTPVRRNLRYGDIINQTLEDVEKVKRRIFGQKDHIEDKKRQLNMTVYLMDDVDCIKSQLKSNVSLSALVVIENQVELLKAMKKVEKRVATARSGKLVTEQRKCRRELSELKEWLLKPRIYLSHQQLEDCSREIHRLSLCFKLFCIKDRLLKPSKSEGNLNIAEDLLLCGRPLDENTAKTVDELLKKLERECTGLGITNDERVMIVKAMGLSQGHWYKCPNGHCYAIGDCGGANEGGTCPDCHAKIGGMNHGLATGNAVAGEMDGARYAAWSEQANLENYDPRVFMDL